MCRNIAALRGLEPPATPAEIDAAALQYVRKVGAITTVTPSVAPAIAAAVAAVSAATAELLASLPARRTPPRQQPASRRRAAPTSL